MRHADWQLVWAILLVLFLASLGAGFQVGRHSSVRFEVSPDSRSSSIDKEGEGGLPSTHLGSLPV